MTRAVILGWACAVLLMSLQFAAVAQEAPSQHDSVASDEYLALGIVTSSGLVRRWVEQRDYDQDIIASQRRLAILEADGETRDEAIASARRDLVRNLMNGSDGFDRYFFPRYEAAVRWAVRIPALRTLLLEQNSMSVQERREALIEWASHDFGSVEPATRAQALRFVAYLFSGTRETDVDALDRDTLFTFYQTITDLDGAYFGDWIELALITLHRGDASRAAALANRAPDLAPNENDRAYALSQLAVISAISGDTDAAIAHYQSALDIRRRLAAAYPSIELESDVGTALTDLGHVWLARGNPGQALPYYQENLDLRRRLAAQTPGSIHLRLLVSRATYSLAEVRRAQEDRSGALELYEQTLELQRTLSQDQPASLALRRSIAQTLLARAITGNTRRYFDDAASYLEALEREGRLAPFDPHLVQTFRSLANTAPE